MAQNAIPAVPALKRKGKYRPTIREAILRNCSLPEKDRLTSKQIAASLGVTPRSVWVALSNMRAAGIISPVPDKPAKDVPGPAAIVDHEAIVERVLEQRFATLPDEGTVQAATDIMDKGERARKLSQIARTAPSNVSVLSIKALEEQERGSGLAVGPPDPISAAERASHLAKLMLACGNEVTESALRLAYPKPESESGAPVSAVEASGEVEAL